MKKMLVVMLTMLVMLAAAPSCLAANVPVYLDGEQVATGLERNGSTYLPLRTMFETVGASVEWEEKTQTITATFTNSDVLTLTIGAEFANFVRAAGGEAMYGIEQTPFVSGGITYVPLRFVTETVLGYDLDWRDNAVYISQPCVVSGEYSLNLMSGQLSRSEQVLGYVDLPSAAGLATYHPISDFSVSTTPAGNYLLQIDGLGSGALTFGYRFTAFISKDNGQVCNCLVRSYCDLLPEPFWNDGVLWLPDDAGSVSIDDATGEIAEYEGDANGLCWWTDGRFRLLGNGSDFDVYDSQKQILVDLSVELITPELKAEINDFLRSIGSSTQDDLTLEDYYWSYLGYNMPSMDPIPSLQFDKAEDGALYFTLRCGYWMFYDNGGAGVQTKEYPLVYQLPE